MGGDRSAVGVRARAVAFALLARSLGEDPRPLTDPDHVAAVRMAIEAIGEPRLDALAADLAVSDLAPDVLAGRWVRWFDLGRVPPYEASNVATSAGGVTPRLADIAGFYRAFGMTVAGNRPDHVVAELEFVALALVHEVEAIDAGDEERAGVVRDAMRTFLRDHLACWLDVWVARIAEIDELAPWLAHAALAGGLVAAEADRHDAIPARTAAVVSGDVGPAEESPEPECGVTPVVVTGRG